MTPTTLPAPLLPVLDALGRIRAALSQGADGGLPLMDLADALHAWLVSGVVTLVQLEHTSAAVTLTMAQAVRFVRNRPSGVVEVETNAHWERLLEPPSGDDVADLARLAALATPRWQPLAPGSTFWRGATTLFLPDGHLSRIPPLLDRLWAFLWGLLGPDQPTSPNSARLRLDQLRRLAENRLYAALNASPTRLGARDRHLQTLMWRRLLDPAVLPLLVAYSAPSDRTLHLYNRLAAQRNAAAQRLREAPGLAGLAYHARLPGDPLGPDRLTQFKAALKERRGLTEHGWRWLTRQPAPVTQLLAKTNAWQLANWSAQFQLNPSRCWLTPLLGTYRDFLACPLGVTTTQTDIDRAAALPGYLFRALTREAEIREREGRLAAFLEDDLSFLRDWYRQLTPEERLSFPTKRLTYAWLNRQQRAWHEEQLQQKAQDRVDWPCLLEAPLRLGDDAVAVPLTDSVALYEEGRAQHHCVASYTEACLNSRSRIVSLRSAQGRRHATLELVCRPHADGTPAWFAGQLRGPGNQAVSGEWHEHANTVVRHYRQRWEMLSPEQQANWLRRPPAP